MLYKKPWRVQKKGWGAQKKGAAVNDRRSSIIVSSVNGPTIDDFKKTKFTNPTSVAGQTRKTRRPKADESTLDVDLILEALELLRRVSLEALVIDLVDPETTEDGDQCEREEQGNDKANS